jgi:hypothetical protein
MTQVSEGNYRTSYVREPGNEEDGASTDGGNLSGCHLSWVIEALIHEAAEIPEGVVLFPHLGPHTAKPWKPHSVTNTKLPYLPRLLVDPSFRLEVELLPTDSGKHASRCRHGRVQAE